MQAHVQRTASLQRLPAAGPVACRAQRARRSVHAAAPRATLLDMLMQPITSLNKVRACASLGLGGLFVRPK